VSGPTPTATPTPTPIASPVTLIEDDFTSTPAGLVFPTGNGVGTWDVSAGGTPEGGQWQANQTGPAAPLSDVAGNLTFTVNATWDQYIDARKMGIILNDTGDTALVALLTLHNANIFFGFADGGFSASNGGAGLFSGGPINFSAGVQDGS